MPPEPHPFRSLPIWDGSGRVPQDFIDAGIDRLRDDAVQAARADAEVGAPDPESPESTEAEHELRDRCRAFLQRVRNAERRETAREVAELEERHHRPRCPRRPSRWTATSASRTT
jgi:hypothetical protein